MFTSVEFKAFMEEHDINHQRITPLWPQANAEAERFMKPLTKAIRSAHVEGREIRKELYTFLLNYRATPHATTGFSPAQLLFNRQINAKLPQHTPAVSKDDAVVRERDGKAKLTYADRKRKTLPSRIEVGDKVLLKQRKESKFSTKYDPVPYTVVEMRGTLVIIVWNGKQLARNSSLLKKVRNQNFAAEVDESADEMLDRG